MMWAGSITGWPRTRVTTIHGKGCFDSVQRSVYYTTLVGFMLSCAQWCGVAPQGGIALSAVQG